MSMEPLGKFAADSAPRKMGNWTASLDILYDMGTAGLETDLPLDLKKRGYGL